ncbi:type II toxin-antitoxin system RelE/ParE family toxin [Patescibacteria group bacterium]|nr:type II toxin-antitoxin system RelE/ParE family toxin [Patescibacteria group bacterium]MBU1703037.1 type II toxin-antitoxin system RelE/ParE family toxin [Patescibacteria group bacterium]MBU1954180.1 type II toxin-antitoxin system RelE/ParE family toxin [Patescibacteria group bacterium]
MYHYLTSNPYHQADFFNKNTIILLHGFIKKTQKIPEKHIDLAKTRLNSIEHI